jgi:hypothetical protein
MGSNQGAAIRRASPHAQTNCSMHEACVYVFVRLPGAHSIARATGCCRTRGCLTSCALHAALHECAACGVATALFTGRHGRARAHSHSHSDSLLKRQHMGDLSIISAAVSKEADALRAGLAARPAAEPSAQQPAKPAGQSVLSGALLSCMIVQDCSSQKLVAALPLHAYCFTARPNVQVAQPLRPSTRVQHQGHAEPGFALDWARLLLQLPFLHRTLLLNPQYVQEWPIHCPLAGICFLPSICLL